MKSVLSWPCAAFPTSDVVVSTLHTPRSWEWQNATRCRRRGVGGTLKGGSSTCVQGDNRPTLTQCNYVSPVAWDEQCRQFPPQHSTHCARPELPTAVLTESLWHPPPPRPHRTPPPPPPPLHSRTWGQRGTWKRAIGPRTLLATRYQGAALGSFPRFDGFGTSSTRDRATLPTDHSQATLPFPQKRA